DHELGALADLDVWDLVRVLEHLGRGGLTREGLPRRATDELERRARRDDPDAVPRLLQQAQQEDGLVGRDAAGDAEDDAHGSVRTRSRRTRSWARPSGAPS